MNSVNLIGRLCRDVEVRYTQSNNTLVASFALAIDRPFAADDQVQADFINVIAWNKTGEIASKYLKKGIRVGVTGRLQTRNYDDKDGKKVYVTEVVAERVYFADGKKDDTQQTAENPLAVDTAQASVTDDDLPF